MKKIFVILIISIFLIQLPIFIGEEINYNYRIINNSNGKYQIFDSIDYSKYGNFTITENGLIQTQDGWYYYP